MSRARRLSFALGVALLGGAVRGDGLEVVAELDVPPGNLTVTPDGRLFVSTMQMFQTDLRAAEVMPDGTLRPFPDAEWAVGGATDRLALDTVLGIQSDLRGVVWMLDNGMRGGSVPKLVAWDTRRDALHRVIYLPSPASRPDSFLNDLAVDLTHGAIYLADPAGPASALVVVDLATGTSRRVLEGDPSLVPQDVALVIDGEPLVLRPADGEPVAIRVGVNPLALDATDRWLYFGPMHGHELFRIETRRLRDATLGATELSAAVELWAQRPVSDGISIDREGNVYITDVGDHAVGVIEASTRQYRQLYRDPERLPWPDAFAAGPDGYLYTVANQIHRAPPFHGGRDVSLPPYRVLRFRPLAPGLVGR